MLKKDFFSLGAVKKMFAAVSVPPMLHSVSSFLTTLFRVKPVSLSGLTRLSKQLEQTIAGSEARFLKLGSGLQSLYESAAQLVNITDESVCMINFGEDGGDQSESVIRMVQRSNAELAACRKNISDSLSHIKKWIEQLQRLEQTCPAIEQIGKTLNVVGVNMAVESSRTEASQVMFQALADEVRQLSHQIVQTAGSILGDSASVMTEQKHLYADIEKELASMDQYQDKVRGLVETSASEIESLMALTSGTLDQSSGYFKKISDQVGQVVIALQFHDIIRQRVEHIVQTLLDVKKLHQGELSGSDLPGRSVKRLVNRLLGLQADQLNEVSADVEGAWRKIESAFDQLEHHADAFAEDSASLGDSVHRGGQIRSKINVLNESLGQLHQFLDQGRRIETEVQKIADDISDTASGLTAYIEQVRNICMALRIKALNAIIKSDLLQHQGRAMEVLAQEINQLSLLLDERVTDVIDILEKLTMLFPEWKTGETAWTPETISIQGILERSRNCENNMMKILQDADTLKASIGTARTELPFLEKLSQQFRQFTRELSEIKDLTASWGGHGSSEEDAEVERIAMRYTMAGERDVHRQHNEYFDKKPAAEAIDFSKDTADKLQAFPSSDEDDDMGDNVELF